MSDLLQAFLKHAAYASAALTLGLLSLEILIPGSVMPFLSIPGLVLVSFILQLLATRDETRSILEIILTVLFAALLSIYAIFILDLTGITGVLLKLSFVLLLWGFTWSTYKATRLPGYPAEPDPAPPG